MPKFTPSVILILILLSSAFAKGKKTSPTVREVLAENKVMDDSLPDYFMDSKVEPKNPGDHFISVEYHIHPSAGLLYVFSRDRKLVGQLSRRS